MSEEKLLEIDHSIANSEQFKRNPESLTFLLFLSKKIAIVVEHSRLSDEKGMGKRIRFCGQIDFKLVA